MSPQKLLPFGLIVLVALGVWWFWPRTQGTITFVAADGTTRVEKITDCTAGFGSQAIFFGVNLKTANKTPLFISDKTLIPNSTTQLELGLPNGTLAHLDGNACSSLTTDLGWGEGNIYSDTRSHVSGQIMAQCPLPDGTQIRVEASVRRCGLN